MRIETSVEHRRGCGHRSPGKTGVGIYLVGPMIAEICERLPYYVNPCNCCGSKFVFFRGWTSVHPAERCIDSPQCRLDGPQENHRHELCAMCSPEIAGEKAMVMFVGDKFYSPRKFIDEALRMGISKRVSSLPKWFEVGKTWLYLAHNKAILKQRVDPETNKPVFDEKTEQPVMDSFPGLIGCFQPVQIDLVVDDLNKIPKRAERLAKQFGDENVRVVKVFPYEGKQESLNADLEAGEEKGGQDEKPTDGIPSGDSVRSGESKDDGSGPVKALEPDKKPPRKPQVHKKISKPFRNAPKSHGKAPKMRLKHKTLPKGFPKPRKGTKSLRKGSGVSRRNPRINRKPSK